MLKHILNESSKFITRISAIAVFVVLFLAFGTTSAIAQEAANGLANPYEGKAQGNYGITTRDLGTWTKAQSVTAITGWLNTNLPNITSASPITTRYQASYYKMVLVELSYDIAIEISLIENLEKAKSALVDGNNLTLAQMKGVYNTTVDVVLP